MDATLRANISAGKINAVLRFAGAPASDVDGEILSPGLHHSKVYAYFMEWSRTPAGE